ncbi:reverse transcriptase [Phytophthora megakarya]|uniref:Reverse transcriptase n=1 Tax=Phytophthora megakarya TaxID=4795 RepID=A0A225WVG9_9STRA|nr:reverse transcriptase [Phytophthora megakarya]
MSPVLGRNSYIDDIAHGAPSWDAFCAGLDALVYRLWYWKISSNEISAESIRAMPKIAKDVQDLPFSTTMNGVQSFLDCLNYYQKFIEDYPVIAASLNELTNGQLRSGRDFFRAEQAFEILVVLTPVLRHPEKTKPYHITEKEIILVLRVLPVFKTLILGYSFIANTSHSVLKCIMRSKTADGRKIQRDEDGLAAILGAGITSRKHLDEFAEELIPAKGARNHPRHPLGSCECILWELPGWKILDAQGFDLEDVTVNDVEYCGVLNDLTMAQVRDVPDLIADGDSQIVTSK